MLDYKTYNLSLTFHDNRVTIPFFPNQPSQCILQARSETLIEVNVLNSEIGEGILPEVKILDGVYLSRAIVKVNSNSKALATVVNTRDNKVLIAKANVVLEPVPQESYIFETNSDFRINRLEVLKSQLRLDHLNSEEKASVLKICSDYNELFYLKGDVLTSTNAIKHKIDTKNAPPIVSKTYRYPEVHKEKVNRQINEMLKQKIISPSTSPWSSPYGSFPKKKMLQVKRNGES